MIDLDELDKKIMFSDAWNSGTSYLTAIICNNNTAHKICLVTIPSIIIDSYKGHKIIIDNELNDDKYILSSYKKGVKV